jgi:hypothetical protein
LRQHPDGQLKSHRAAAWSSGRFELSVLGIIKSGDAEQSTRRNQG